MAASGIRSIRYAKELTGISKVLANDMSTASVDVILQNTMANDASSMVAPTCSEAW